MSNNRYNITKPKCGINLYYKPVVAELNKAYCIV